jgi:hypothetical protein
MRVTYIAEHDDGRRIVIPLAGRHGTYAADVAAAGRECRRLLESRPTAFRVECWSGTAYVTKAQRGAEVDHGPLCMESCCMPTPKETGTDRDSW